MSGLRLAFMGTPDFSCTVLQALLNSEHEIVCVYSQPPRRAGRGKSLRPTPVHKLAEENGIEVRTPLSLKDEQEQAYFTNLNLDAAIVVAYGLLLPKAILDAPKYGCLNIHASLLPRWRGAAPIQRAIMAGDRETGVGIMQMAEGLDTGDVLSEARTPIHADTTAGSLHDDLAELGANLLLETLPVIGTADADPQVQPDEGVTYAKKIDKAEAKIDWRKSAEELSCHIRGLSPFPGAYFEKDGTRVKLLNVEVVEGSGAPGSLVDDQLTVACGEGALKLTLLQRAGKSPMDTKTFLNGYPLKAGEVLE
ncbi:methionyl-tRNA formyltransferase [Sneathiella sp. P13V-1]|uniref:methionyl-tRNA formyltransferase n=1 Tax=Sneathiella sp. P13V-1 TaxID=2697366 RepID=UPI00187B5A79|nr:methionyl-tRNA formyltransferase [Sneathiella sp. P13V-1]MBE7635427.1 methionyl-tRNA formyltransferase [Sneathiella sp. P13V-1]